MVPECRHKRKSRPKPGFLRCVTIWRPRSELNRRTRICSPLHNHSATRPDDVLHLTQTTKPRVRGFVLKLGAGKGTRTLDPDLGKVVLYQLSYSRVEPAILRLHSTLSTPFFSCALRLGQAARAYSKPDHSVSMAAAA